MLSKQDIVVVLGLKALLLDGLCLLPTLQFIQESVEWWQLLGETLAFTGGHDDLVGEGALTERILLDGLPVIEAALWEGLAGSGGTEIGIKTEGLIDGQVGLDLEHRGTRGLLFLEDVTTLSVEDGVDTTHGLFWALDLDQVDGLEETWGGGQAASVQDTASSWDDLSTTTMDGISVKGDVVEIESDSTHVFVAKDTLL